MKAKVSKRTIPETGIEKPTADYEQLYIRSFEERITSLEGQLDDKQKIIEKLLEEKYSQRPWAGEEAYPKGHLSKKQPEKEAYRESRTNNQDKDIITIDPIEPDESNKDKKKNKKRKTTMETSTAPPSQKTTMPSRKTMPFQQHPNNATKQWKKES